MSKDSPLLEAKSLYADKMASMDAHNRAVFEDLSNGYVCATGQVMSAYCGKRLMTINIDPDNVPSLYIEKSELTDMEILSAHNSYDDLRIDLCAELFDAWILNDCSREFLNNLMSREQ